MAESVMITLAATIGRSRAHEVVANVVLSMEEGENLSGALRRCLDSASLETLEPLDERLDPGRYLGDAVTNYVDASRDPGGFVDFQLAITTIDARDLSLIHI